MNRRRTPRIEPKTNARTDTGIPVQPKPRGLYRATLEASGSLLVSGRSATSGHLGARRFGNAITAAFAAATLAFSAFGDESPANAPAGGSDPAAPAASPAVPTPAAVAAPA